MINKINFDTDGYFFCYDRNLAMELIDKGFKPITISDCPIRKRRFTLFKKTVDLSVQLKVKIK